MQQTIDTERIKQSLDLRLLSGLDGDGKELDGPCPKCGGVDRFHVRADYFFCRQCYPIDNGLPHDAIAYVQWLQGVDFKTACSTLAGGIVPTTGATAKRPEPKAREPQPATWQYKAQKEANRGANFLNNPKFGEPGREYLLGRGLTPATWEAFGLGYDPEVSLPGTWDEDAQTHSHPKQPAIVIPWFDGGELRVLNYRFIEKHTYTDIKGKTRKDVKSKYEFGSRKDCLFGEQTHEAGATVLVLCEGELNAASVWQVTRGRGIDVLSLGSENTGLTPAQIDRILQYKHVLAWLDKRERAKAIMALLPGAHGLESPKGKDANDWLQAGKLEALIFGMLQRMGWKPTPAVDAAAWQAMTWAEKLFCCSDRLGLEWERLSDNEVWLSRWDEPFKQEAVALFRQIDAEFGI